MIKAAIEKILSMAPGALIELGGRQYTTAQVFPVKDPVPETKYLHTLTGLVDYITENPDGLDYENLIVHVLDPRTVSLVSTLYGDFKQRCTHLKAVHDVPEFNFGQYYDVESFIIALQAQFLPDDMTAKILQLVGNLTDSDVRTFADDGVTQQVTATTGIGRKEAAIVPNPVILQPRRTFCEIEQPVCSFVLRMKSNGEKPHIKLVEADGGAWRLSSITAIRAYMQKRISTDVVVIA